MPLCSVCFLFTNNFLSCFVLSTSMTWKNFQIPQSGHKYGNEIFFIFLFVSAVTVNKYVLSELKFTVPTVFQGWQTLSCVILLSVLIKFKKITNDLQILDAKAVSLLLPALICFACGIVSGSKALADLPVPVFLAVTNLYPALLILFVKKKDTNDISLKVCGSTAILGTVIIIFIYSTKSATSSANVWLLGHVFFNIFYYVYLNKLNLDLTNTTQIYYRNFFSVIVLLPISVYLDVLHLPRAYWQFYTGCVFSGILGTLLQIWTFKLLSDPDYVQFEGFAKVLSSVIAYNIFFVNIDPFIWVLIVINFLVCATFLKSKDDQSCNVKSEILQSLPPPIGRRIEWDRISLV